MKKEDVLLLYKINNIIPEKSELYLDFIESLYRLITTTYLGDELMDDESIKKHFNWCWSKTIESFRKEFIFFEDNIEIYSYFYSLFMESFYEEENKTEENIKELMDFWLSIFNYEPVKTRSDIESFFDLYKLFDKSFHV